MHGAILLPHMPSWHAHIELRLQPVIVITSVGLPDKMNWWVVLEFLSWTVVLEYCNQVMFVFVKIKVAEFYVSLTIFYIKPYIQPGPYTA
jgi:hypothetical protein